VVEAKDILTCSALGGYLKKKNKNGKKDKSKFNEFCCGKKVKILFISPFSDFFLIW